MFVIAGPFAIPPSLYAPNLCLQNPAGLRAQAPILDRRETQTSDAQELGSGRPDRGRGCCGERLLLGVVFLLRSPRHLVDGHYRGQRRSDGSPRSNFIFCFFSFPGLDQF
jgi:hypothetical protein